jgi:hypothetical protein
VLEIRRALPGLASGLALAVRPAGAAEAPALKGGSRRSFLRSGRNDLRVPLTLEGTPRTMCGVPAPITAIVLTAVGALGTAPGQPRSRSRDHRRDVTAGTADLRERARRPGGGWRARQGFRPRGRDIAAPLESDRPTALMLVALVVVPVSVSIPAR